MTSGSEQFDDKQGERRAGRSQGERCRPGEMAGRLGLACTIEDQPAQPASVATVPIHNAVLKLVVLLP